MFQRAGVRLQSRLDRVEGILCAISLCTQSTRYSASTYRDKCREQAARARSNLCPVSLGPLLGLLAPQDRSRDFGQIPGPVGYLLDIGHILLMLRHTGFR
jgi:hypothetical protein